MELYNGNLDIQKIIKSWTDKNLQNNYGAFIYFIGIIRDENSIDGLHFEIYKPILEEWFQKWKNYGLKHNIDVKLAHSIGDVMINESSYISAIFSKHRKISLKTIDIFVEDFKKNAPIWKYEILNKQHIYNRKNSLAMDGSGLLY